MANGPIIARPLRRSLFGRPQTAHTLALKRTLPPMGYLQFLKKNPAFRNLWYGQAVSELGDWLNSIAIFALVLKLDGRGMTLAAVMTAKLLPVFFVSPFAGILIDRMDRKTVMFVSDILRFLVVLCFLFIDDKSQLWMLYALVVVEISLAGFFEPARSAIIPSLTAKEDLVTANTLSGATWSVMLALGAAIGGVIVSVSPRKNTSGFVFLIGRINFVTSALSAPSSSSAIILNVNVTSSVRIERVNVSLRAVVNFQEGSVPLMSSSPLDDESERNFQLASSSELPNVYQKPTTNPSLSVPSQWSIWLLDVLFSVPSVIKKTETIGGSLSKS